MSQPDPIPTMPRSVPGLFQRALGGGLVLALGAVMLVIARDYPMGRLYDMGPGFVPVWTGVALCLMGLAILIADLRPQPDLAMPGLHWRGLIFVSASILAFAGLIQPAGLVPAMFAAVAISKFGDSTNRVLPILIYAAFAALGGWALFLVALELPIRAFWR